MIFRTFSGNIKGIDKQNKKTMHKTPKIYLNLHNKLALSESPKSSRALITTIHLALAMNWAFVFFDFLPIIGILPAFIAWIIERKKKSPFAIEALNFAKNRILLHIGIIFALVIYSLFSDLSIYLSNPQWIATAAFLVILALYDAYYTYKGGLGFKLIRPLTEQIKRRFKKAHE